MLPRTVISDLPWNTSLDYFPQDGGGRVFERDPATGRLAARSWFDEAMGESLARCYRKDADPAERQAEIAALRHACRVIPSAKDEEELGFHGRRVRGEIFFARRWILVEGVTEYLLVHALGNALNLPLDMHGIAVIDFQQSGSAGIYPALAEAFGIPWHMITDGDHEATKFRQQILDRGFTEDDLTGKFTTLPQDHDLEGQLLADGHEQLLREIMGTIGGKSALTCPLDEFRARLKNKKTGYMGPLSLRVAVDKDLAAKMPAPFVDLIKSLGGDT
jgi:putative ATP-dependent endonuclease of OLD family